jgi:hypothetical protein
MKRIQATLVGAGFAALVLIVAACGNTGSSGSSEHPTNIPGMGGPTLAIPTDGPAKTGGTDSGGAGSSGSGASTAP